MPGRHPTGLSLCRRPGCRAQIRWTRTKNEKALPVDADPNPTGNVAVYVDERSIWRSRVLGNDEPRPWETLYMPHAATCAARTAAAAAPLPPGVTSLTDYRERRHR